MGELQGNSNDYNDNMTARVLASVHAWDLIHGSSQRDWKVITAEIELPESANQLVQQYFRNVRKNTDVVFPFPPIPLSNFVPEFPTYQPKFDKENLDPAAVGKVIRAAMVLEPQEMKLQQVKHFLGFHEDPQRNELPLEDYDTYMVAGLGMLPANRRNMFSSMESNFKTVQDYDRKSLDVAMMRLIDEFKGDLALKTKPVRADKSVRLLNDISYVRRPWKTESGLILREVLSDYELYKLYFYGLADKFDFEAATFLEWREYMQSIGIENVSGWQGRLDFFKFCLPRIGIIRRTLAPNTDSIRFSFSGRPGYEDLVDKVIYHASSMNMCFAGIMKTIFLLNKFKMVTYKQLGGHGVHYCTIRFIMRLLSSKTSGYYFSTSDSDLTVAKESIVNDLITNYCYFKTVPKPYRTISGNC